MIFNLIEIINIIASWSISGTLFGLLIYFLLNPEKVEKWASIFAKFFAFLSLKIEKLHISKDIQYKINSFRKEINKECEDLIPYEIEIKFINPTMFRKESCEHQEDKVIIIMKDRKNQDENFVKAAMISTEKTLIPNSRNYINPTLMKSIDLQFIKNLILSSNKTLLNYYIDNYLAPELKLNKKFKHIIRILEKLSDRGVFTRILLQELKDYGMLFYPKLSNKIHYKEPKYFFKILEELANKEHKIDINPNYIGEYIKMSIVMIGRPERVFTISGEIDITPYINWIFSCEKKGIKSIYLLALSKNIIAAKKTAKLLDEMPKRFKKFSESNYNVKINTKNFIAICIRYQILENI